MELVNWNPSKGDPKNYKLGYTDYFVDHKAIDESIKVVEESFVFTEEDDAKSEELLSQQKLLDAAEKKKWDDGLKNGTPVCLNRKTKLPLHGKFNCNYHVKTVGTLELQQASSLLYCKKREESKKSRSRDEMWYDYEPQELTVQISYPLSKIVEFKVPLYKRIFVPAKKSKRSRLETDCMDPGYFMWVVSKVYSYIYDKYEEYGVWGHVMGDLYFEGFNINWDGRTQLWIGS